MYQECANMVYFNELSKVENPCWKMRLANWGGERLDNAGGHTPALLILSTGAHEEARQLS